MSQIYKQPENQRCSLLLFAVTIYSIKTCSRDHRDHTGFVLLCGLYLKINPFTHSFSMTLGEFWRIKISLNIMTLQP